MHIIKLCSFYASGTRRPLSGTTAADGLYRCRQVNNHWAKINEMSTNENIEMTNCGNWTIYSWSVTKNETILSTCRIQWRTTAIHLLGFSIQQLHKHIFWKNNLIKFLITPAAVNFATFPSLQQCAMIDAKKDNSSGLNYFPEIYIYISLTAFPSGGSLKNDCENLIKTLQRESRNSD